MPEPCVVAVPLSIPQASHLYLIPFPALITFVFQSLFAFLNIHFLPEPEPAWTPVE